MRKQIRILFTICLLVTSYSFLFYGFYLDIIGLKAGDGYVDGTGMPIGHDFVVYWSASKISRSDAPENAYDLNVLNCTMSEAIGTSIPQWAWNYPPIFFLFIYPLSLLDYPFSYVAWASITFMLLALIISIIMDTPLATFLLIGFPAVVYNLFAGQNGFLTAFLFGAGLLLVNTHPFWGGVILSLLLFKPHLTILIPIALIAGRHWIACLGFIVGGIGCLLISLFGFGSNSWLAFLENLPFSFSHWQNETLWLKMPSLYALARLTGVNLAFAAILHFLTLVLTIILVIKTWSQDMPFPVKGTILTICTVLASPYLFPYDLCLLTLVFAWHGKEIIINDDNRREAILIVCWVGLYLSIYILPAVGLNISLVFLVLLLMLSWNDVLKEKKLLMEMDE